MARRGAMGGGLALLAPLVLCMPVKAQPDPAAQAPHQISFTNQAGRPMQQIYITPMGAADWGANRLMAKVPAGFGATIRYTGTCRANLRVVVEGGLVDQRLAVNVCGQSRFVVTGNSITSISNGTDLPIGTDRMQFAVPQATGTPAILPTVTPYAVPPSAPPPKPVKGAINPRHWKGHFLIHRYGGL